MRWAKKMIIFPTMSRESLRMLPPKCQWNHVKVSNEVWIQAYQVIQSVTNSSSRSWRSLNHPKRGTTTCQVIIYYR